MQQIRFTFDETSALRAEELAASLGGWLADVEPGGKVRLESSSPEAQSAGDVVIFVVQIVVSGVVAGVSQLTVEQVYKQLRIGQWREANGNPKISLDVAADDKPPSTTKVVPEEGSQQ